MKQKIILVFIIFLSTLSAKAQDFSSYFKQLDNNDGLSQITINTLLQDRNGFIWAGTQDGLNRFDGKDFVVFRSNPKDSTTLSNDYVNHLIEDGDGNIWVVTQAGGVCKYNPRNNLFKRYKNESNKASRIRNNVINTIHVDNEQNIWVGHQTGVDIYNKETDRFLPVIINGNIKTNFGVNDIKHNRNGLLWLATSDGLKLYNPITKKIEKDFKHNAENANSISANSVNNVFLGKDGLVWILLPEYILNAVNPENGNIKRYFQKSANTGVKIYNPLTRFIHQSKSGRIWLATELNGLVLLDSKTGKVTSPYKGSASIANFTDYQATTILEDKVGSFWVGTLGNGLLHYDINGNPFGYQPNIFDSPNNNRTDSFSKIFEDKDGFLWFSSIKKGLTRLNPKTGSIEGFNQITQFLNIEENELRVQDIIQDKNGNIWLGTRNNGFIRLDPKTGDFKIYDSNLDEFNITGADSFHLIKETQDGILWLASKGVLSAFNPETESVQKYIYDPNNEKTLPGNTASAIFEDNDKNLWIGFYASGLFKLNRKTGIFTKIEYEPQDVFDPDSKLVCYIFQNSDDIVWIATTRGLFKYNITTGASKQYSSENGLANNTVYDILDDNQGNLWLSTNEGISKFNPETEIFKNFHIEDGLQQSEFNFQAGHKSAKTGLLYFGGTKGFNVFHPEDIEDNNNIPLIKISEFRKYDADGAYIGVPGINYLRKVKLSYDERDFSVKIASLDYTNPKKNKYAYWLEGYNNNWIETDTKNEINFTNLSPGNYILKVKGSNNEGVWNEVGKSIKITILPPWWGSWPAYTIYILGFLGLLYAIYRYRLNKLETLRLKELDKAKKTMYTNITHEFRTPLTVISGITKELRERSNGNDIEYLDLIERNSKNMLYLVNQLLELRKLEIGKMKVNYIQDDIIPYLKYITECFKVYAENKDITLHFLCIVEKLVMDYDPDKLFMIMSNLLSNAIKYGNAGEDVFLQVDELDNEIQIRVVDSGDGIPEQELPYIFERFYKVQNKVDDNIDGIGIGLAVTKELVELLNGRITVSSKIDKGSIFSITLPIEKVAPKKSAKLPNMNEALEISRIPSYNVKTLEKTNISPVKETLNLLVIEDNIDILSYLKASLCDYWNMEMATNGKQGIETAIEKVPDIILCDLMMPKVDGYMALETLKNDPRTSHIPIVILTAKADDESRIKAYKKGADAFLLKPFNKEELITILKNLVEQRKLLQDRYKTTTRHEFSESVEVQKEDLFIKKLEELVLSQDPENAFSVLRLCEDMGMSRTQLHNKVKALTGKSTSIFVRSLRLKKGKHLLKYTDKSISEIAYEVGFSNPSYFTKSFTDEFGFPPSTLKNYKEQPSSSN